MKPRDRADRYYRACEGTWQGAFRVRRADLGPAVRDMGLFRGAGLWLMARLGVVGTARTTVELVPGERADHTTRVSFLGLPVLQSRERIVFGEGEHTFEGEERGLAGWRPAMTGRVQVEEGAEQARYFLDFGGVEVEQHSTLDVHEGRARGARITQRAGAFETEMALGVATPPG